MRNSGFLEEDRGPSGRQTRAVTVVEGLEGTLIRRFQVFCATTIRCTCDQANQEQLLDVTHNSHYNHYNFALALIPRLSPVLEDPAEDTWNPVIVNPTQN